MSKQTASQPKEQKQTTGKTFSLRTGVQAGQFGSPCATCYAIGAQNGWSSDQMKKNCAGVCG